MNRILIISVFVVEDKFVGMLITMGSFFVTIMLIYGAIKVFMVDIGLLVESGSHNI